MDKDKIQELLDARAQADLQLEKMRSPVTILFSDIKGSTAYFEQKGDLEGLAMVERHNGLLIPQIEGCGGRVVKTIGDAIMACFIDPVSAVKAAANMQRVLEADRAERPENEQIHIRVGLHTGLGLLKDNDVYGDVVNAASRVQHEAQPDQIVITDVLLDAVREAGFQCAKLGKASLRGKDEPIDLYAMAWSDSANDQLVEELQAQFERRLKEMKRVHDELEEELDNARNQWRAERRRLNAEIEQLEEAVEGARHSDRVQASEDLQSEIRFQLDDALRLRQQIEEEFVQAQEKWQSERDNLKEQITSMQGAAIEAMERSNNPARMALAVREQVDARVADARREWQLQWDGDRKRLNAEIERLKKSSGASDLKKDAARRALLEKLGKAPAGSSGPAPKTADQWEAEFSDAKIQWETERDQLRLQIEKLERTLQHGSDAMRSEIYQEMRASYEPKLAEEKIERSRLEKELASVSDELQAERQRLTARIEQIENAIPEARDAVRKQVTAELVAEYDIKLEEATRLKSRSERRLQEAAEEFEGELRRARKQVSELEEQLREAREAAFKAQRGRA